MSQKVIACPKCKKKYSVGADKSGKKLKCPACQTSFVVNFSKKPTPATVNQSVREKAATAATQTVAPAGGKATSRTGYAEFGLDGPLREEADLFSDSRQPGPPQALDNYAVDAGFGNVDPERFVEKVHDPKLDNPIYQNRALTHAEKLTQKILKDEVDEKPAEVQTSAEHKEKQLIKAVFGVVLVSFICLASVFFLSMAQLLTPKMGGMIAFWVLAVYSLVDFTTKVNYLVKMFERIPLMDALLSALIPVVGIYFLIVHWSKLKYAFFASLIASVFWMVFYGGFVVAVIISGLMEMPLFE